jgi:hypothetical protein
LKLAESKRIFDVRRGIIFTLYRGNGSQRSLSLQRKHNEDQQRLEGCYKTHRTTMGCIKSKAAAFEEEKDKAEEAAMGPPSKVMESSEYSQVCCCVKRSRNC